MSDDTLKLSALPLFPLNTVLYPGGILPLRIFEVRYLDMVGKCHKADAPFGLVCLTPHARQQNEVSAPPSPSGDGWAHEVFQNVGTLARITHLTTPQAGLMVIQCLGLQRFQITSPLQRKYGLWIADVTCLAADQTVPIPPDLQGTAHALGQLIQSLQARGLSQAQMPLLAPHQLDDCAWVANRWCELLPLPPELKQRLMMLDNPLLRLELVSDILERTGIAE